MCNGQCIQFGQSSLTPDEIKDKDILDVGANDVNGSYKTYFIQHNPKSYIGVDIQSGNCVDKVCSVYDLVKEFGENSFDIVISTEMMEHVEDWRLAISQMKKVLRPTGYILITTRSKGFGFHSYPDDFWRYELKDMLEIFSDFKVWKLESDSTEQPGVFIKAQKPSNNEWQEKNLSQITLYRMEKP